MLLEKAQSLQARSSAEVYKSTVWLFRDELYRLGTGWR